MKNEFEASALTIRRDDSYCTRQHAFNIGLAYTTVSVVMALCVVIVFKLHVAWLLRGLLIALLVGVCAFAKSLVDFTHEAREIQWQNNVKAEASNAAVSVPSLQAANLVPLAPADALRAHFPSPRNDNGLLFTDINLTPQQRLTIAQAALNHGKLTVNYLLSIGLKRDEAERLREELVSHNLLMFNDRHETVLTEDGQRSFKKMVR